MSDNIFFPSVEEINNDWGPGEVIAFLETHKKKLFLRDVDIKPIKDNWVAGLDFLLLTRDKLLVQPYNLLDGPATRIVELTKKIKGEEEGK